MSKRRYRRSSKMKRRGVENASQHGVKMAPTWLQHCFLEASGQPLGPDPAARHSPAVPERLWHGPGRPKNSSWRPWNALGATSGSISVPGRVPARLWEVFLGAFGRLGPRERKKRQDKSQDTLFLGAVFACVFLPLACVVCLPRRLPASKHKLKKCSKLMVFTI